jgi:transposase
LARLALADENVARLIAIPGIDMVVALAVIAAIGDINRFGEPQKLVSYLGLNPNVRQWSDYETRARTCPGHAG